MTPFGPGHPGRPGHPPAAPVSPATAAGIIPLRPLTLTDIYNGAVGYVRAHPAIALGLAAVAVVLIQSVAVAVRLTTLPSPHPATADPSAGGTANVDITGWDAAAALLAGPVTVVVAGMLTVVVGRSVFGAPVTVPETWAAIRTRLGALIALAVLGTTTGAILIGLLWAALIGVVASAIAGIAVILLSAFLLPALYAVSGFAEAAIVLERLSLVAAIGRAVRLIRNGFWRVIGIVILTFVVVSLIGVAMTTPFMITGLLLGPGLLSMLVGRVGMTIVTIVVLPFTVGVLVLLYTDRRIRSEAFDLAVQPFAGAGAPTGPAADRLWLSRAWA